MKLRRSESPWSRMVMTLESKVSTIIVKRDRSDAPNTEELSSSSAEGDVGASEVVDSGLGEHGVVLKLGLAERGAVAGDEDKLG